MLVVLFGRPIYGNIRHMLFALPPVLLFAGLGVQSIADKVQRRSGRVILVLAVLLPGITGIVLAHPYEYSYFNAYIGGFSGAFGQFHVDPWCTSFREAMLFLNEHIPSNSEIAVRGPAHAAEEFAREDLEVYAIEGEYRPHDFVLICQVVTEGHIYQDYPVFHTVRKGDALLSVVKARP